MCQAQWLACCQVLCQLAVKLACCQAVIKTVMPTFAYARCNAGNNELDQITKIHNIIGTPPPDLLAKMKKRSAHMTFDFPQREGSGIAKLIAHCTPDCQDLIIKLLAYNPDDRLSARQALRHPYFKELR